LISFVHPWHSPIEIQMNTRDRLKSFWNAALMFEIYQESVIPYLETNWFRLRLVDKFGVVEKAAIMVYKMVSHEINS
jgi:hypothetical protein